MKNVGDSSDLTALLRDLEIRLQRQERHTHIFPPLRPVTIVIPAPEPPPPVPECAVLCDEFTGVSLGSAWETGPYVGYIGSYTPVIENHVADGAYMGGENNHPYPEAVWGSIQTVASYPGDAQYVEVVTSDWFQGNFSSGPGAQYTEGEFWLLNQLADDGSCLGAYCLVDVGPSVVDDTAQAYVQLFRRAATGVLTYYDDGWIDPLAGWETNPAYTFRLETTVAGHAKVFFDGMLLAEGDLPPVVDGGRVGLAVQWNLTSYVSGETNPGTAPRFESFCGGCLA